jgi:hypothetical protein
MTVLNLAGFTRRVRNLHRPMSFSLERIPEDIILEISSCLSKGDAFNLALAVSYPVFDPSNMFDLVPVKPPLHDCRCYRLFGSYTQVVGTMSDYIGLTESSP